MIRDFTGLTDEDRLKFRNDIMDMDPDRLQKAARDFFTPAAGTAVLAVYADDENLRTANEMLDAKLQMETLV